jgi:hypothetical protein
MPTWATDRLDDTGLYESAQRRFRYADMTADPDELDTPLSDQPSRETLTS